MIVRVPPSDHPICGVRRASWSAPCTLPKGHLTGSYHTACDDEGDEIETWKDGDDEPI